MKNRFTPHCRFLVVALACMACSSEPLPPPPRMVGTYALEAVNGAPLPVQAELRAGPCMVESGFLDLQEDGTIVFGVLCAIPAIPPQNVGGAGFTAHFNQVTTDSIEYGDRGFGMGFHAVFGGAARNGTVLSARTFSNAPMGAHAWRLRLQP